MGFDKTTDEDVHFIAQMPHAWKEGSEIRPHIHWTSKTGNSGNVVWVLEYTKAAVNGSFPATTSESKTLANPSQYEHKVQRFSAIDMTGCKLSTILICRLSRDANNELDTLDEDAYLLEIDFHFQRDAFGSEEEFVK